MLFERNSLQVDTESDPDIEHFTAGETDIFLVEREKIITDINKSGKDLILEQAEYDGPITSSKLAVTQHMDPQNHHYRWLYNGDIKLRRNVELDTNVFFDELDKATEIVDGFELEELYFNNNRLIIAEAAGALALIGVYEDSRTITYRNETRGISMKQPSIYAGLTAPTIAKLEAQGSQPFKQLAAHTIGFVLILNTIAEITEGKSKISELLVTPRGPMYPTAKKGRYESKPDPHVEIIESVNTSAESIKNEDVRKTGVLLHDIGGLREIRADLKRVAVSFNNAEAMERWGAERPQGIFLYGPPGTGKTTLAQALANEIGGELWEIKSSAIFDKWLGNSEKNAERLFAEARHKAKPTIMLLDEFEGLINSTDSEGGASLSINAVVAIFKKEMSGLRENNPNIIVVATTNYIEKVDESLIRAGRFDIKHYVPLPDQGGRTRIFSNAIADKVHRLRSESFSPFADDPDAQALAEATEGMSGADIVEVLRRASFSKAMQESISQSVSPISQRDLLDTITEIRQS